MLSRLKSWLGVKSKHLPDPRHGFALSERKADQLRLQWFKQFAPLLDDDLIKWAKKAARNLNKINIDELPRPPRHLPRLIATFRSGNSSPQELASDLRSDPTLSGNLLKVLNSPLYRSYSSCSSVEDAIIRLGADGFTALIATAIAQPLAESNDPSFQPIQTKCWEHAALATHIAEYQCSKHKLSTLHGFMATTLDEVALLCSCKIVRSVPDQLTTDQKIALIYQHHEHYRSTIVSALAEHWMLDEKSKKFCVEAIFGKSRPAQILKQAQSGATLIQLETNNLAKKWANIGLDEKLLTTLTHEEPCEQHDQSQQL